MLLNSDFSLLVLVATNTPNEGGRVEVLPAADTNHVSKRTR